MPWGRSFVLTLFIWMVFGEFDIQLSSDNGNEPVMVGQSVTLRCTISPRLVNHTLSIIFLQNVTMKSENCKAYDREKYDVTCENEIPGLNGSIRTYLFHIRSVSWTDRGKWTCMLSGSTSDVFLDVHVPPKMALIQAKINLASTGGLSGASGSDSGATGADLALNPTHGFGRGTRTYPYDLRSGIELILICQTECGYPMALPEWTVNNMSESTPRKLETKRSMTTQACENKPETSNMTTTRVTLGVQCDSLHLTGLNKLRCAVMGSNDFSVSRHVYVLCPGGQIQMALTGGEMIGLGVAAIALFSLLIAGCVLLRSRSKQGAMLSSSHSREVV